MKALVLAAGLGERLRPFTDTLPKVMLPIGGRPALEHTIRLLRQHGITDLYLNLHYLPEQITDHFGIGSAFGVKLEYLLESELSGDAGPLHKLRDSLTETFAYVTGDNFMTVNFTRLIAFHRERQSVATVVLSQQYEPADLPHLGVVVLDEQQRVKKFVEKPKRPETNLVSGHVWLFEPKVLEYILPGTSGVSRDLVPKLLKAGERVFGYVMSDDEYLLDFGTKERYGRVQRDFVQLLSAPTRAGSAHG